MAEQTLTRRWNAVLARIGTPTGDKRIIAPGALSTRDLPLPLMWQRVSGEGHGGAVTVGVIESMTIDNENGMVTGEGRFLDVRGAAEAAVQTEAGVTGPSVDLFDDVDIKEVQTLIEAGVLGPDLTSNFDDLEYVIDENDMVVITNARIAGATLVQIPAFAGVSITLLDDVSRETSEPELESLYASVAVSRETLPPLEWFAKPDWDRPTPLVVSDTGRVYGHIAQWGVCHIGLPGCVTPPSSNTAYAHFLTKPQLTSDGITVPVGVLTAGGGHADAKLGLRPAAEHYDDPLAAVAKVFAGEDEFGIWVAGWVLPYAQPERVAMLRDLDVSGDWRQSGGNLELIAACAVNTAGFPQRKVHFSAALGGQQTLIGQFKVQRQEPDLGPDTDSARAAWARATWKGRS